MKYTILSDNNKTVQELFLCLPKLLYDRETRMQDEAAERAILEGTHLLSADFSVYPFVVTDGKTPISRGLLTVYPGEEAAYFGYFESFRDREAAKLLFDAIMQKARELEIKKLTGPVNASFWIGYRLKTDAFSDPPFTGEPYNLPYYEELLLENGFSVTDRYISDLYIPIPAGYSNKRLERREKQFAEKGIEIRNLDPAHFDESMGEVWALLTKLYADFPAFRPLDKARFMTMFSNYRKIVRPEMVKFAYCGERMAGFFICVPDYGNLVYRRMTPWNILSLLRRKKKPKRFVLLYLGAEPEFLGLGALLTYRVIRELEKNGAEPIGALIHAGKVTQNYARDLLRGTHSYALYSREL